jgi:hypothetical protein
VVAEERWITGFVEGELHVGDGGRGAEGGGGSTPVMGHGPCRSRRWR